jgi:hypothetical protein
MKTLKISFLITLLAFNFGCEKPDFVHSSDSTINQNTNVIFFIEYDIDGEKIRYEVDTVDMYMKNEYPKVINHYSIDDNLYFSYPSAVLGYGYMRELIFTENQLQFNPFGVTKSAFPKVGFFAKIPFFSDLSYSKSIKNDTITPANGIYQAEKFVIHLTKSRRPLVAEDTNTYEIYEAGVVSAPYSNGFDSKGIKKIKPSEGIMNFQITSKKSITYKRQNIFYTLDQLDGEFSGKMRKYWSTLDNINYGRYVNVKIKFSLPMGRI